MVAESCVDVADDVGTGCFEDMISLELLHISPPADQGRLAFHHHLWVSDLETALLLLSR